MPASLTQLPIWQKLKAHHEATKNRHMRDQFAEEPHRFESFSRSAAGVLLDFSKNRIDEHGFAMLCELAEARQMGSAINDLFSGVTVNTTEDRPALHTALRSSSPLSLNGSDISDEVAETLARVKLLSNSLYNGERLGHTGAVITDVVNIGIGGSDLGPQMVCAALKPFHGDANVHFVSNVDGADIQQVLEIVKPESTLFIVTSKSFTTQETSTNFETALRWFRGNGMSVKAVGTHFVAVTANPQAAHAAGFLDENIFGFSDWVGGRFSLWSAVGLSIAVAVGFEGFQQLLNGANAMDEHFQSAPIDENIPVIMGLLAVWYGNFYNAESHCVAPYDQNLRLLPKYLQQLDMESLGKGVTTKGEPLTVASGQIVWGAQGSNAQHAFFQLLHQGPRIIPVDFILPAKSQYNVGDHQQKLLATCLAQSRALMLGKNEAEARRELAEQGLGQAAAEQLLPHKIFSGNRPSNTLIVEQLNPFHLGSLIALYEHRVFVQATLWGINAFDQWGVELGKQLAGEILGGLRGNTEPNYDSSTNGLLAAVQG